MPASKYNHRLCEICGRKSFNARMLGPLLHTTTISAHFNCVLFSAQTPDATNIAARPEDDAIAGVTSRFIRSVGMHAKKLVIFLFVSFASLVFSKTQNISRFFLISFNVRDAIFVNEMVQTLVDALTSGRTMLSVFARNNITSTVDFKVEHRSM